MKNEKVLVTGASGEVALPVIRSLSGDNEVWGAARFTGDKGRDKVEAAGAKAVSVDLASGDLSALPQDFTYVVHLAWFRGGTGDFDSAIRLNGEGVGFVLQHCRTAKAALVMSSTAIYAPHEDPWYFPKETDPICPPAVPWAITSGASKLAQESVARYCARSLNLPVVITRLSTVYGDGEIFMPNMAADAILAGREVTQRWDPMAHSPIHIDDICGQLDAMLAAASVPANIVNWGGDDVVTIEQWCQMVTDWSGVPYKLRTEPSLGASRAAASDQTKRRSITGPSTRSFKEAFRESYERKHGAKAAAPAAG